MQQFPRKMRFLGPLSLAFLLTACDIHESNPGQLDARATATELILDNGKNETIYYYALGSAKAALTTWYPGFDGTNDVKGFSSKSILLSEIAQEENEQALIVYWWTYMDIQNLPRDKAIQHITVTL